MTAAVGSGAWLRWLVPLFTAGALTVGYLANTTALNGIVTGEVARRFDTPFTPAGYVFGIWGPLYAAMVLWSLWQLAGPGARSARVAAVRLPYLVSAAANMSWLLVWHYFHFWLSLVVIGVLVGSLYLARQRLAAQGWGHGAERWLMALLFRAYLAWATVATLANAAQVAVHLQSLPPVPVALAGLALAALICVVVAWRWRDLVFLAVAAWAAVGIALKPAQPAVVVTAAFGLCALVAVAAVAVLYRRFSAAASPPAGG